MRLTTTCETKACQQATIARPEGRGPETRFSDQTAWQAHLDFRLGFNALKVTPEPVRVATEGAWPGSVQAHEFLCDAVVLRSECRASSTSANMHACVGSTRGTAGA